MKTTDFYVIKAVSNIHAGSGEGDFSVVDKQVQRDPVTGLPTIHASGIKGALREAMEFVQNPSVSTVFGGNPKKDIQQGTYNFYDAQLLALPIRSSHNFYYLATCPYLLESCSQLIKSQDDTNRYIQPMGELAKIIIRNNPVYFGDLRPNLQLEDWTAEIKELNAAYLNELEELLGKRIALLSNEQFAELAGALPIIARNYLDNGISKNLWYEEVVPREARFVTMVSRPNEDNNLGAFLDSKNGFVQLGANATVGYGLCHFNQIG